MKNSKDKDLNISSPPQTDLNILGGVVILISGRVTYEHISTIKDKEGRFIMIHGQADGNLFALYNVYIPPGSEPNFYTQVIERIASEAQGTLVCGGDFNTMLNPNLGLG